MEKSAEITIESFEVESIAPLAEYNVPVDEQLQYTKITKLPSPVNNNTGDQFKRDRGDTDLNTGQKDVESIDKDSNQKSKWKKGIIDDSDSEEEIRNDSDDENSIKTFDASNKKKQKSLVINSDSESEIEPITVHNKSFSDDILDNNEQPVFTRNSEGKLIPEKADLNKNISTVTILSSLCDPESSEDETNVANDEEYNNEKVITSSKSSSKSQKKTAKKSKKEAILSSLCDPESSEDEINIVNNKIFSNENEVIPKTPKKKKPKSKKTDVKKPKKMTRKEAVELRQEIKSESQRMVREKNVSLPYHKPKSYTLKEFLSRRPKFSSAVPIRTKAPPSVAIKMSKEQLSLISEKLKEREKEVEKFYKSDESEDDPDDKDFVPPTETDDKIPENVDQVAAVIDNIPIQSVSNESKDEHSVQPVEIPSVGSREVEKEDLVTEEITSEAISSNEGEIVKEVTHVTEEEKQNSSQDLHESDTTFNCIVVDTSTLEPDSVDKSATSMEENDLLSHEISEKDGDKDQCSADYEFNLDGLDENSENIEKNNPTEKSRFEYTDLDREIENFGSEDNDKPSTTLESAAPLKTLSKLELIKERLANIKPKLTGGPDDVIDLESGVAKPNEVIKLMERFVEHNFKKPSHKNKVQLSVVNIENGEVHKETVAMKLDDEDQTTVVEEKPGAKLQKLRDELQNQMAQKRSELWQKKTTTEPKNEEKDTYEGEKEDCGFNDDILDDEEEMEISESSEEDEDEEMEESNEKETEKKKSDFIDEEAEESDQEEEDIIEPVNEDEEEENEADDENDNEDLSEAEVNEVEEVEEESHNVNESEIETKKKTFKKILKGFTEDSDEEEETDFKPEGVENNQEFIDNTPSQEEDIPPHQPQSSQTPIRQVTQNKGAFEFLTPVSYLTGLQNLNSASKNLRDSPVSTLKMMSQPSPLKESNWQSSLQKKLFAAPEITDSQVEEICSGKFPETQESVDFNVANKERLADMDIPDFPCTSASENEARLLEFCSGKFSSTAELAEQRLDDATPTSQDLLDICSGKFTGFTQQQDKSVVEFPSTAELAEQRLDDATPTSQDLLDICSGKFTGFTQQQDKSVVKLPSTAELAEQRLDDATPTSQDLLDICSGKFTGFTQQQDKSVTTTGHNNKENVDTYSLNTNDEIKNLDEDQDLLISQLMDEEEMEKFKKRFEPSLISDTQKRVLEEFEESLAGGGVIDSDDEADTVEVKKKNRKRLMFSDDEDSEDDVSDKEEVIDLHDNIDDEDSGGAIDNVAYDSEENEIELVDDDAGAKLKPSDFFENEAELSESEWGSEDEDEKDLDAMEFEQADTEKYDEKQIRTDLEKIHMRQLLDDDTRQVKLLQEMLLEDGELHGTGRERQFRWKNMDSAFEADDERKEEDDAYFDDEESEEQWRKRRHEREMFLQEKLRKSQGLDDDDLLGESQLLKIGQKVLQRSQSNSQNATPAEKTAVDSGSPVLMRSFSLLNKRGSFLSRGDQVLQRLAEYNKVTSVTVGTATAKNSRNFLFQTVSVEESSSVEKQDKKRKGSDGTPHAIKRLRLSDNFSPIVKKKPKAKGKLFGNW